MANYKMHTALNLAVGLPACVAAAAFLEIQRPLMAVFASVFAYGTLFASPDLDLAYQNKLWSVRGILTLPFRPYARLFSHRGLSHSFLFGTLTRVLWLGMYVVIGLFLVYSVRPTDKVFTVFVKRHQAQLIAGGLGLVAADWCHLIVDIIWSPKRQKGSSKGRSKRRAR